MVHAVKCHPDYFSDLLSGKKKFEVRKNDRPFKEKDILAVNKYLPPDEENPDGRYADGSHFTDYIIFGIEYILNDPEYCKEGYVILGLTPPLRVSRQILEEQAE